MAKPDYDICVIGGGINGAGIAREAAGRGLSVLLVEAQDLAGATSSASTKLIHGGLRYLQYYEFKLVRESLIERERLLNIAPHIIWPLEFVLPYEKQLRPYWMISAGLFLYDHLSNKKSLPDSKRLNFKEHPYGKPLKSFLKKGFSYSDCWVEDSRLVILNALDAKERGAKILTRTACTKLTANKDYWDIHLQSMLNGNDFKASAEIVVNAAGPWVSGVLEASNLDNEETPAIKLVKGSHIIVPKLFEGNQAYILQQPDDERIVFAIPYERDFTLIGTTEVAFDFDPTTAKIDDQEIEYLCEAVNRCFNKEIDPDCIVSTYSGVRPLIEDGEEEATKATRDYKIQLEKRYGPKLLNIFGGKITTYRKLAETALNKISSNHSWTAKAPLPGGDIPFQEFNDFITRKQQEYDWLPKDLILRYARAYGSRMDNILDKAHSLKDMGRHFGMDLYEREVSYLINEEWAWTTEDILWRRSKLGLHIDLKTKQNLEAYMAVAQERIYAT
jgi:glycerol-3-phosphate dehydrogenase